MPMNQDVPTCAFGRPWRDHFAPPIGTGRGCRLCVREGQRLRKQFAADVKRGTYDRHGYTPAERRAQQMRRRKAP